MRWRSAWVVATKDLAIVRHKRGLLLSVLAFPLGAGIGLPIVLEFAGRRAGGIPAAYLPGVLDSFSFFFMIGAVALPTAIASYSLVGEKVERSLEPLLATPTTDSEILLGKAAAAFLPPLLAIYLGAAVFMGLSDAITRPTLGHLYYPNWTIATLLLAVTPLACLLAVEASVLFSARVNDIRSAQQMAGLLVLPFTGIYVAAEIGVIPLDAVHLLEIAGALLVLDVALFFATRATFRREEILTRWK